MLTRNSAGILGLPFIPTITKMLAHIPLHKYLDQAYKKVKTDPGAKLGPDLGLRTTIPISIFMRSKGGAHVYAGNTELISGTLHRLDEEEYFTASLAKVAAMFAAFKLRGQAKALAKEVEDGTVSITGATQALKVQDFFNKLEPRLKLGDAVPEITGASGIVRKPIFAEVLAVTGSFDSPASLDVQLTADFKDHMRKMIIPSDNCSAGECIRRLSYPYINVKLMEAGFFDKTTMKGIWLCGDYIQNFCFNAQKKQSFIRIPTINDCDLFTHFCGSAQNATSKEMARFFFRILMGDLIDPTTEPGSNDEMLKLLQDSQKGNDPSFLVDDSGSNRNSGAVPRDFHIDAVKIGQGPIKPDPPRGAGCEVRSEGILIKWKKITPTDSDFDVTVKDKFDDLNLTGEAAICWQNVSNLINTDGITEILNTAIGNFIDQAPLTP